jgi:hypothetical protein
MRQALGIFLLAIFFTAGCKQKQTAAKVNGVYSDGADSIAPTGIVKGLMMNNYSKQYKNRLSVSSGMGHIRKVDWHWKEVIQSLLNITGTILMKHGMNQISAKQLSDLMLGQSVEQASEL